MTRKIKEMVFLGAGDSSKRAIQGLHERLDEALGILGGLQQPLMSTDTLDREVEAHEQRVLRGELLDAAADIMAALGVDNDILPGGGAVEAIANGKIDWFLSSVNAIRDEWRMGTKNRAEIESALTEIVVEWMLDHGYLVDSELKKITVASHCGE